ncbi:dipeptide epimerase [Pseudobacillus wudalianchiensis]|uniref:Dipeptide epimerase n=1 Tax=Pseudobacillus wudalianchiensis TaxID=1743143 RepID=A0A1B9AMG8_9BACI|nr:dipeptide epimerase [Bacillus wudalianchiensis]OCA85040.1 dipeptide epimerase [Bacillus wudalianchiensis]
MYINKLKVSIEKLPLVKPFKTALRTAQDIDNIFVTIELENGVIGMGAAAPTVAITGDSTEGIAGIIEHVIAPQLIGQKITQLNLLSQLIQQSCVGNTSAKAAVEIAVYDAACRYWKIPLFELLGGQTNQLRNDMTISIGDKEEMVSDALKIIGDGFSILKIKAGKDWEKDVEGISAIREAVGDKIMLRIDANQGWSVSQAIQIIRELEDRKLQIELVEQPVKAYNIAGLKEIKRSVHTPIMADESLFSPIDAMKLLSEQAVDYLNIKLMKTGGIRRALQIADMAEAAEVECMIGSMMESIVSVSAAIHLAAAHPNITKIDLDAPLWIKQENFEGITYEKDLIQLGNEPGLGIKRKENLSF